MTGKVGNTGKERTYKSVLFEVLPEAIDAERSVSGRIDVRGLFYACRRLYLGHPDRPRGLEKRLAATKKNPEHILEYDYFGNRIVPYYEAEYGETEGLIRDPRGHLHEAHTADEPQEIGTEFVREYVPPDYYYDKVLYVEKHGIAEGLVDQRLGQKYDMAILASKGYGTVANRELLEKFADEVYELYILHDCDVDGFGILANLQEGNSRAAGLDGTAVDLGLRLADARQMGLLGEEATRQKSLPASLVTLPDGRGTGPVHGHPTQREGVGVHALRAERDTGSHAPPVRGAQAGSRLRRPEGYAARRLPASERQLLARRRPGRPYPRSRDGGGRRSGSRAAAARVQEPLRSQRRW